MSQFQGILKPDWLDTYPFSAIMVTYDLEQPNDRKSISDMIKTSL